MQSFAGPESAVPARSPAAGSAAPSTRLCRPPLLHVILTSKLKTNPSPPRGRGGAAVPSPRRWSCPSPLSTFPSSTPTTTCTRRRTPSRSSCRPEYSGLIKYVEVNGRTKIAVRNVISEYIPNPTFNVVGRPGCVGGALQERQPRGEDPPRADGGADPLARGLLLARAAPRAHGRVGPRPCAHVADAGQPARGAPGRRPHRHPRRGARAERVDARALDVQLRGPDLRVARHHAADRRRGDQGARVGGRAGRQAHPHPARAGSRLPRLPVVRPARVRPLLAAGDRARRHGRHARLRRRPDPLLQPVGGQLRRRAPPVRRASPPSWTSRTPRVGASSTRWRR